MTTFPDSLYQMGGIGSAWSDVDTSIFVSSPIPNTAGGKALAAT